MLRPGQARKSLWIETSLTRRSFLSVLGQARKSLWIETNLPVKLVVSKTGSGS